MYASHSSHGTVSQRPPPSTISYALDLPIYRFIEFSLFGWPKPKTQAKSESRGAFFSPSLSLSRPARSRQYHESPTGGTHIFQLSLYLVPVGGFEFPSSAVQSSCDPIVRAHGRQRIHHDTKHPTNIHIISRYAANKRLHAKQSIHKALWNALEKTKKKRPDCRYAQSAKQQQATTTTKTVVHVFALSLFWTCYALLDS